jgi:hypothetical protein
MTGGETVTLSSAALEAMLERAAEAGAKKALAGVGLHDDDAPRDVRDLRDLIESWRDAKKEVGRTVARLLTTALLAALVAAAAVKWWRD